MTSPYLTRRWRTFDQVTGANVIQFPLCCDQDPQRSLSVAYHAVSADWSGRSAITSEPWPYEKGAEPPKFLQKETSDER